MYLIKTYDGADDSKGTMIHSPYANGEKVTSGTIELVGDGVSSFKFTINPENPAWNNIRPLHTLIDITEAQTNKIIFSGRVLQPVQTMSADGLFHIAYQCESELVYLQDSTQRHGEYNDMTVSDFLQVIINRHNQQVEPYKRFEVGEVTVSTSTDNIYRFLGYEKTFKAIQSKLIDRLGGHIRVRKENGVNYLDYLESVGEVKNTPIQLRTNLKDMQKEIDPTDVITRLVPLGARLETESESSVSEPRLTVESVNDSVDYLDDDGLIEEFGIIEGNIVYDDINTASTLKLRGEQFFAGQRAARVSYDVNAPDLSLIDTRFEAFEVDGWYHIENPVFAISEPLQVIGKTIDIYNPELSKLQIGEKYKTLSDYQAQANRQMLTVQTLEERVDNLGSQNATLNAQLEQAQTDLASIQQSLADVDVENLPEELQTISGQITSLQTDLDNLDIPTYELATPTTDGLMSALDKAKLDGLESYSVATDLQDGLMSADDKVALDELVVDVGDVSTLETANTTDLVQAINELNARLETLEGGA